MYWWLSEDDSVWVCEESVRPIMQVLLSFNRSFFAYRPCAFEKAQVNIELFLIHTQVQDTSILASPSMCFLKCPQSSGIRKSVLLEFYSIDHRSTNKWTLRFQNDITDLQQRFYLLCGSYTLSFCLWKQNSPPYKWIASRLPCWSRKLGLGVLERVHAGKTGLR